MNSEEWNNFILKNKGSFLQSYQWGEFQEAIGRKIWRIEGDGYRALIIRHNLPLGMNYLYCPRPVIAENAFKGFLEQIREIARQEKSIFFKIEPETEAQDDSCRPMLESFGFRKSTKEIQPLETVILDLTKSESELLGEMHQKTRYNIKLAQKKGIRIESNQNRIDVFWRLLQKTARRDRFYTHLKNHYERLVEVLGEAKMIKLFLAKHQGKPVAANLVLFFHQTAIYLHGASDYEKRNLMAPHLLQWHSILEAKKLGFKHYDLWGIDEKGWPGVTRFKLGFGGRQVSYPGAFDLALRPFWCILYDARRKVKKLL